MMQTIAAVAITWGWFHKALEWYQVLAALALMFAVAMVQRAQATVET
jgi:drug/metabolite transporter (DMT)-like permease